MPFYKVSEMAESHVAAQPMGRFKGLAGELMKVGFVTYLKGEGATPHYQPQRGAVHPRPRGLAVDDSGAMKRNSSAPATSSTSRGGPSTAASSSMRCACSPSRVPAGDGSLDQDHNDAEDAEAIVQRLEEKLREFM